MNVLLARGEVDYDAMKDMDDINDEFARTDVAIVIGANDVTDPSARNDASSPIYGMPILNVDKARSVIVLKRSMNSGFAGIDNPLFLCRRNHDAVFRRREEIGDRGRRGTQGVIASTGRWIAKPVDTRAVGSRCRRGRPRRPQATYRKKNSISSLAS